MPDRRIEWLPVAQWEIGRMLRRADFVISILITPLLGLGVGFFATTMASQARKAKTIAVVRAQPTPESPRPAGLPPHARFHWVTPPAAEEPEPAIRQAILAKAYEGAVFLPATLAGAESIDVIVRNPAPGMVAVLEEVVRQQARVERAAAAGLDTAALARVDAPVAIRARVANPAAATTRADRLIAFGLMFILFLTVFTAASYMMVGISGEKQARVTEVVVSAIRPESWMDGKIIAYTILGLITAAVWVGSGLLTLVFVRMPWPSSISLGPLLISALFGTLGFAFYAAMFGALMATMKDLQSASKAQGNFFLVPMIPMFLIAPLLDAPDAPWMIAIAMIPFFSPMMFPVIVSLGAAQPWQTILALVLLAVATWYMRRFAGYAFRTGMLMYGKDMTLPELMRWSRR